MTDEIAAEEIIARALCRHAGFPENAPHEGAALWTKFLPEARAALKALNENGFHVLGRSSVM